MALLAVLFAASFFPSRRPWSKVSADERKNCVSPFMFTMRCGGFSSLWRPVMTRRNAATAPPHWKSILKCSLWTAARR